MCSIIYNNDRASGGNGTVALPECAYAAGAVLKLTWSSEQDSKYKPIKSTHGIFHQRREKRVSYVAHSKDLVYSEDTLIYYAHSHSCRPTCMHGCYLDCIRAVNSSEILARIRSQSFAIFRTLRRKLCQIYVYFL